jgi:serine/threonine protein kinase
MLFYKSKILKCFFSDVSHDLISVRACRGYMAPEYLDDGVITIKSDIYSVGVIIRHMVKGRNSANTTDQDVC